MDGVSRHYTKLAEQQRITLQIDVAVMDRAIKKLQHHKNKKKIIKGGGIMMAMGAVVLTAGLGLLDVLMVVDICGTIGAEVWSRIRRRSFMEESW